MIKPGAQLKLAAYVLIISLGFALLGALNSWSAYRGLLESGLASAPTALMQDLQEQTQNYLRSSLVLLAGYVLVVLAFSFGYLHRLIGPTVALERCLRALGGGNYSARVTLRDDDHLYGELARQLNDLAAQIERAVGSRAP
jgi:signal transduction histidine kinase